MPAAARALTLSPAGATLAAQDAPPTPVLADAVWSDGLDAALRYCARASGAETCPTESRTGLIEMLLGLGVRDAAATLAERLITSEGGTTSRYELLARARLQQGRTGAAAELYEEALATAESADSATLRRFSNRLALLRREALLNRVAGAYRTAEGDVLVVKSDDYLNTYPQLLRLSDGRFEVLYPAADPHEFVHYAEEREVAGLVTFVESDNDAPPRLVWSPEAEGPVTAVSISRGIPFEFENAEHTLSGTAWVPRDGEEHAASILLPGAGPGVRSSVGLEAVALTAAGVVGLAYDKRGTGRSSGSRGWFDTSIEDQVSDAVAAYEALGRASYVRHEAVGLWGFSQGGWVAPEAASRVGDAAFVVLASGAAVSLAEQMIGSAGERARRAGLPEADRNALESYMRTFFQVIHRGGRLRDLDSLAEAASGQSWVDYAYVASLEMEPEWFRTNRVDPGPALGSISSPALALFGAEDNAVIDDVNVPLLASYLTSAPTADFSITVIPEADHGFRKTSSKGAVRYSPLYFSTMMEFIADRTAVDRTPPMTPVIPRRARAPTL